MSKKPSFDFSFESVLKEIENLSAANSDGFTTTEMADATGRPESWCRDQLRKGVKVGKVKCNGRANRMRIDGVMCPVPVYIMVQE